MTQPRILVIEDSLLIAEEISLWLEAAGFDVVGPVGHLAAAFGLARLEKFDAALFDIDLHGKLAFPVADALIERHIRFGFVTGFQRAMLPERYRLFPYAAKPVNSEMLLAFLQIVLRSPRP